MKLWEEIKRTVGVTGVMLFLLIPGLIQHATASETLLLTTYAGPPLSNVNQNGACDLVIKQAFKRIDIDVDISQLPAERSISNANLGIVDGDFVRISGLSRIYPNLVEVPEMILHYEFMAFTRQYPLESVSWQDLKPYHVGIVRGWKILETNLDDVRRLQTVKNQDLLFTLLDKNRIDFVVYARHEGSWAINRLGFRGIEILEPPLITREMFLYLNNRHRSLVPKIVTALREMKKDGSFARIFRESSLFHTTKQ
jgi:polar amino acid transport system substrate-binding protein